MYNINSKGASWCDMMFFVQACPDSAGDELVIVPNVYSSHNYKIRVSTWSEVRRPASSCSPKFEIRARDRPYYSTPSPTAVPVVESTSLYPRPPCAYTLYEHCCCSRRVHFLVGLYCRRRCRAPFTMDVHFYSSIVLDILDFVACDSMQYSSCHERFSRVTPIKRFG